MTKFSKKSVLLFASVMAVCAFAVPSMASAASWGIIGTAHTLDSSNLGFSAHTAIGLVTSSCAEAQFGSTVTSAAVLTINTATFKNCTGAGAAGHCTVTSTAVGLPWRATGTTTTNVQIDGVHINVLFETRPGATPPACALNGNTVTLTGNLNSGAWNAATHSVAYANATGLRGHSALGSSVATVTGTIRDTQQTLTLT